MIDAENNVHRPLNQTRWLQLSFSHSKSEILPTKDFKVPNDDWL